MRHEDDGCSSGCVLLSFLLGGVVGAGVALLLAPEAGSETRRRIRELAEDAKEKTSGYMDEAKGKVLSSMEKGKDLYEDQKSAIAAAFEAGREAYEKEVHK